ncbi:type I toxin-antitoxin system SymE family toxin [Pseudothauera nasutitermitis]|uniref:Type I toxin-antitoxin system SymE family toxin n=1 Tax=Pseudothauera nasutitermitis TaxID=2565930 RepID=A0A4S4B3U6_9RHOO|nr:type I toxin-antitoxin system SymE family toxin [Pseudothauera nasutitermitis]
MAVRNAIALKPRLLTIRRSYYEYHLKGRGPRPPAVPWITLRGYWIHRAGFSAGQRVKVLISDHSLTIVPA